MVKKGLWMALIVSAFITTLVYGHPLQSDFFETGIHRNSLSPHIVNIILRGISNGNENLKHSFPFRPAVKSTKNLLARPVRRLGSEFLGKRGVISAIHKVGKENDSVSATVENASFKGNSNLVPHRVNKRSYLYPYNTKNIFRFLLSNNYGGDLLGKRVGFVYPKYRFSDEPVGSEFLGKRGFTGSEFLGKRSMGNIHPDIRTLGYHNLKIQNASPFEQDHHDNNVPTGPFNNHDINLDGFNAIDANRTLGHIENLSTESSNEINHPTANVETQFNFLNHRFEGTSANEGTSSGNFEKRRVGSEFLGKRGMGSEFLGKRGMGSEFLGKRRMGYEFLGKRGVGSEFLGKRDFDQANADQDVFGTRELRSEIFEKKGFDSGNVGLYSQFFNDRFGSKFMGKREISPTSLGKEKRGMGSEFLGKRSMHDVLLGQKEMDSEFFGKRTMDEEYLNTSSIGS